MSVIELEKGYNITGSETFGWTVVVNGIGVWKILPLGLVIESLIVICALVIGFIAFIWFIFNL